MGRNGTIFCQVHNMRHQERGCPTKLTGHSSLHTPKDSYSFVRIKILSRFFAKEIFNFLLNHWHSCLAANKKYFIYISHRKFCIIQCNL